MNITKNILTTLAVVVVVAAIVGLARPEGPLGGGVSTPKCTVSSTETAVVGGDLSTTVLAANGTRAWASIQVISSATNTVALSFDEGTAAVLNEGFILNATTTTTGAESANNIEFGRATSFPYTGAVTGIASNGTSSVAITECSY